MITGDTACVASVEIALSLFESETKDVQDHSCLPQLLTQTCQPPPLTNICDVIGDVNIYIKFKHSNIKYYKEILLYIKKNMCVI